MGGTERRSAGAGQDLSNKDTSQLLQRLKAFAGVALVPHRSGSPHMQALVSKLQDALASVERFPVQCSHLGYGASTSSSLRAFGGSSSESYLSHFAVPDMHANVPRHFLSHQLSEPAKPPVFTCRDS